MKLDKDWRELLASFRSNGVEFLVVGGHAVTFHGYPRYTEDPDRFVRPDAANGERIVHALEQFGFGSLELKATDFTAADREIQLGRARNRVDLLTRLYGLEFEETWRTRTAGHFDGIPVWNISGDALIRNTRATGRTRDLADAEMLERVRAR